MRSYKDDKGSRIREFDVPMDTPVFPHIKPSDVFTVESETGHFVRKYIRVNFSLDIETTKVGMLSAPYIITMSLNIPHTDVFYVYHTRNWDDTKEFLDKVAEEYGVGQKFWSKDQRKYVEYPPKKCRAKRILFCFVHNLSYEFQFMRKELDFDTSNYGFFSKDSRKAMKAALQNGIEFRDTLPMTNTGLEKLSQMFTKHKKVKDLDYLKMRNTMTPLDDTEMRYINDDVIILNEFEDVYFDRFCQPGCNPPMTNTGRLLLKVERAAEEAGFDFDSVPEMQPSISEIKEEQKYLFRGGFVHANIRYIDVKTKCRMRDITSSYPTSMLTRYVPMDKFGKTKLSKYTWKYGEEPDDFKELINTQCVKMRVIYVDLKAKTEHSYESQSKLINWIPPQDDDTRGLDNGRIRAAELIETMQTELDYQMYERLYTWSAMKVVWIKIATRGMLPEFLQKCVIEDYKKKTRLKVQGLDDTEDYVLAKIDVNTYFGLCCKAIYTQNVTYDFEAGVWDKKEQTDEEISKDLDTRCLCYNWGMWIATQSRFKLVDMLVRVEQAGGHVVYYDTDSLKYIPSEDGATEILFEEENKRIEEERKNFPLLQDPEFSGKSGKGLGEWDAEHGGVLVEFKTLGAKRYLFYDGKEYTLKVAGLPKAAVKLLPEDPWEMFSTTGFTFSGESTGKLAPKFQDEEYDVEITDDYGQSEIIHCKSGVTLMPIEFKITEKKLYTIVMQKLQFIKERRS